MLLTGCVHSCIPRKFDEHIFVSDLRSESHHVDCPRFDGTPLFIIALARVEHVSRLRTVAVSSVIAGTAHWQYFVPQPVIVLVERLRCDCSLWENAALLSVLPVSLAPVVDLIFASR
jgi:hypothetical protein